jgi:hypothetical protein
VLYSTNFPGHYDARPNLKTSLQSIRIDVVSEKERTMKSALNLFWLVLLVFPRHSVDAYATTGHSFLHKYVATTVPSVKTNPEIRIAEETHVVPRRTTRYDLGIGKNLPVNHLAGKPSSKSPPPSAHEACRYLVEHQPVREIVPPGSPAFLTEKTQKPEGKVRQQQNREIRYNRSSQDVLPIVVLRREDAVATTEAKPTMVAHTSAKVDMNTPWVEMLIHYKNQTAQI